MKPSTSTAEVMPVKDLQPEADPDRQGTATPSTGSRAPELEGAQGLRLIGMLQRPDDGPHEEWTRGDTDFGKLGALEHAIDTLGTRLTEAIQHLAKATSAVRDFPATPASRWG